jgi:hypothetical protein
MSIDDIELTTKNFILYAAQNYSNPHCVSDEEFYEDLQRLENLKKLFKRFKNATTQNKQYAKTQKLVRIILNNIIIFNNVFEHPASIKLLFYKVPDYHSELKTILTFLNLMPEIVFKNYQGTILYNSDIAVHTGLAQILRKI